MRSKPARYALIQSLDRNLKDELESSNTVTMSKRVIKVNKMRVVTSMTLITKQFSTIGRSYAKKTRQLVKL